MWLSLQLTPLYAPFASCLCNLACLSLYLCSSLCLLPMQPGLPAPLSLQLTRSLVVAQKGGDAVDKVRTSYSASLKWVRGGLLWGGEGPQWKPFSSSDGGHPPAVALMVVMMPPCHLVLCVQHRRGWHYSSSHRGAHC